jgi:hypothetical protein
MLLKTCNAMQLAQQPLIPSMRLEHKKVQKEKRNCYPNQPIIIFCRLCRAHRNRTCDLVWTCNLRVSERSPGLPQRRDLFIGEGLNN